MAPYYDKQGNEVFFAYPIDAMEAAQRGDVTGTPPGGTPAPKAEPAPEPVKEAPAEEKPEEDETPRRRAPRRRGEET